jgi:Arc/MetJ-type ribon-helix-helix transcriptional regulator
MGKVTSFSPGEHSTSFVEAQVKEGRYNNACDARRPAPARGAGGADRRTARRSHRRRGKWRINTV